MPPRGDASTERAPREVHGDGRPARPRGRIASVGERRRNGRRGHLVGGDHAVSFLSIPMRHARSMTLAVSALSFRMIRSALGRSLVPPSDLSHLPTAMCRRAFSVDFGLVSGDNAPRRVGAILLRFWRHREVQFATSEARPCREGMRPPFPHSDPRLHEAQLSRRASAQSGEIRSTHRCA